jgi:hypothetical protein
LEISPCRLKLDTKNSSETGEDCVAFVPDNYVLDDISETMCIKLGSQPRILINDCQDKPQIQFQYSQLTRGLIFCNITKDGDTVRFDFDILGSYEVKLVGTCKIDTVWVIFTSRFSGNGKRDWIFYYKSVMAGRWISKM